MREALWGKIREINRVYRGSNMEFPTQELLFGSLDEVIGEDQCKRLHLQSLQRLLSPCPANRPSEGNKQFSIYVDNIQGKKDKCFT